MRGHSGPTCSLPPFLVPKTSLDKGELLTLGMDGKRQAHQGERGDERPKNTKAGGKKKRAARADEKWHTKNPDVTPAWESHQEKTQATSSSHGPRTSHYSRGVLIINQVKRHRCVLGTRSKQGECLAVTNCQLAHVPANKMTPDTRAACDKAFAKIYE